MKLINDNREVGKYPPFDHHKRFCERIKDNWLTTDEFRNLLNSDLISITKAISNRNIDSEYLDELMKVIDKKEPNYLKDSEYFRLIFDTPLENLQRIYKKYNGIDFIIQAKCKLHIEFMIGEKKRKAREQ